MNKKTSNDVARKRVPLRFRLQTDQKHCCEQRCTVVAGNAAPVVLPTPSEAKSLEPLLSIREAAPFIGKKPGSIRCDVTRNPGGLPQFIRRNGRIYFLPSSIRAWQSDGLSDSHARVAGFTGNLVSELSKIQPSPLASLSIKRKSSRPRKSTALNRLRADHVAHI